MASPHLQPSFVPAAIMDETFARLRTCVIVPTYNNAATVGAVIQNLLGYTSHIIIVNDGATDGTEKILAGFPGLRVIGYAPNRGKGHALRTGFRKAAEWGYQYAITIDSDGQHFARDLPVFLEKLQHEGSALIMGARNMHTAANVPGKSSFGNRFSNFWYRVETGIRLPDTQTGYRLYPLKPLGKMKFFTTRFEFEIEAIVRLAWAGVKVVSAPITVYYPPAQERVSHFRPWRDFLRISVLNTILVTICFFYIWPRNFLRFFFRNKNWKKDLRTILLKPGESDVAKANAVAFGGFMGVVPLWGFQLLLGIPAAHFMRLNKTLFIIAANISIPPMIPLIVFLSFLMGKPFMGNRAVNLRFDGGLNLQSIGIHLEQYIYGALLLAVLVAGIFWLITFFFLKMYRRMRR